MSESPTAGSDGIVIVQIKSNGTPIPDKIEVLSITTDAGLNTIPKAVLTLRDGDAASNKFPIIDSDLFKPGAMIEIFAGYNGRALKRVFKGVVVANRLRMSDATPSQVEITCHDEAFRLTLGRHSRVFEGKKDSAILAGIAKDSGLNLTMPATAESITDLVQYHCSDWDFIVTRAEVNGMVVSVKAGDIYIAPPKFSASPVLEVTYGIDALSFDAQVDVRDQYKTVKARGWNSDTQEEDKAIASLGSSNKWGNLNGKELASVGERGAFVIESHSNAGLKNIAEARQIRADFARLIGTVRFAGSAKATLGETLKLKGFGKRFSGTGLISRVRHNIEDGTWTTEARLGLEADWLTDKPGIEAPGTAGLLAPTRGLHIGKVTKLTEEAISQKLIQVRLPILGEAAAPIWCRFGMPYAANMAGIMFLPEIGDEVVVGFFNDDPGAGVILGSLHSAKIAPPIDAEDKNNIKAIVTREQLKVSFDEEKKSITIETPGGNMMTIDDDSQSIKIEDQHKNAILLSSTGIVLDSPKDIKIKAGGNIDIAAKADVKLSGANINAKADVKFSAVGTASADVKAAGVLTVQGAIVKIN